MGREGLVCGVSVDMYVRSRLLIKLGVVELAMTFRCGNNRYRDSVGMAAHTSTSENRGRRYSGGGK